MYRCLMASSDGFFYLTDVLLQRPIVEKVASNVSHRATEPKNKSQVINFRFTLAL